MTLYSALVPNCAKKLISACASALGAPIVP